MLFVIRHTELQNISQFCHLGGRWLCRNRNRNRGGRRRRPRNTLLQYQCHLRQLRLAVLCTTPRENGGIILLRCTYPKPRIYVITFWSQNTLATSASMIQKPQLKSALKSMMKFYNSNASLLVYYQRWKWKWRKLSKKLHAASSSSGIDLAACSREDWLLIFGKASLDHSHRELGKWSIWYCNSTIGHCPLHRLPISTFMLSFLNKTKYGNIPYQLQKNWSPLMVNTNFYPTRMVEQKS